MSQSSYFCPEDMLPEEMTNSQWLALVLGLFEVIIAAPNHLNGDHISNAANHESIADSFSLLTFRADICGLPLSPF